MFCPPDGPEQSGPDFPANADRCVTAGAARYAPGTPPGFFGAEAPHRGQNPARSSTVEAANFTFSRDWAIITCPTPPASPPAPQPTSRPLWGLEPLHERTIFPFRERGPVMASDFVTLVLGKRREDGT